jgi:uncharacterized protein (TIGR02444 family)
MSRKIITGRSVLGVADELKEKSQAGSAANEDGVDLWTYANAVYASPGVAAACLRAQDEYDLDVNILLFAAWLGAGDVALASGAWRAAEDLCAPWREEVVKLLRSRRRAWRDAPPHPEAYAGIKALELEAERQQLSFLEQLGRRLAAGPVRIVAAASAQQVSAQIRGNLSLAPGGDAAAAALLEELASALGAATVAAYSEP